MAITLFVCSLVTAISAAPSAINGLEGDWQKEFVNSLEFNRLQDVHRAKRSSYGNLYMSPCAAAAASAPIPAYAPSMSSATSYSSAAQSTGPYSYSQTYQTVPSHKPASSYYSYGRPYYRSEEELDSDQEIMDFSDMNHAAAGHIPMARYSYDAAPVAHVAGAVGGIQGQASGQIVGLFPNANVGGCSVPLLVSCSPSIAQGQIVKARPYYDGNGSSNQGNMYRVVDNHLHHEEADEQEKAGLSSEHTPHDSKPIGHKHQ